MSNYQRPFLKWAGNKYQVLSHLLPLIPSSGARFIEPFVGSGSVFLNVLDPALNKTYQSLHVADSNADLPNLYQLVKKEGALFSKRCTVLFAGDAKLGVPHGNDRTQYDHLRDVFNKKKVDPALTTLGIGRSELFVYLNRHCFNGLCRYNSKGEFNVPFGRYKGPNVPVDDINIFHSRSQKVQFQTADYLTFLKQLSPGVNDVVYLDPPYLPLSATSNFTDYSNDGGFSLLKQKQLAWIANYLASQGCTVIVSNHDTPVSRQLYEHAEIHTLSAPRFISGKGARTPAPEIMAVFTPLHFNANYKQLEATFQWP